MKQVDITHNSSSINLHERVSDCTNIIVSLSVEDADIFVMDIFNKGYFRYANKGADVYIPVAQILSIKVFDTVTNPLSPHK